MRLQNRIRLRSARVTKPAAYTTRKAAATSVIATADGRPADQAWATTNRARPATSTCSPVRSPTNTGLR